jgi:hypothetical protein
MTTTMESVSHDPEFYVQYHQRGVLKWFERVVEHIGINLTCVKLSLKTTSAHPYHSRPPHSSSCQTPQYTTSRVRWSKVPAYSPRQQFSQQLER